MSLERQTISILTFNIHGERDAAVKDLEKFLIEADADVICLQEHNSNVELNLPGYVLMSLARGEAHENGHLCNAIYVKIQLLKEQKSDVARSNIVFPSTCLGSPPRCAAAIYISGITIVNTHQTGGCGDDSLYVELANVKSNQIQKLVRIFDPDIIVGDLNAEANEQQARRQMQTYHLYKNLTPTQREAYMTYYLGGHRALQRHNYSPAYDEETIGSTSAFGGTPDWIYTRKNSKKIAEISEVKKLKAIPRLSDHNAVLATISINN